MVISPGPSHSLGIFVVRNHVVVVRELLVADGAYSVLFLDFSLQKLPHFSWGPEFPIPPRVMRVFDALHSHPYCRGLVFLSDPFPATAEQGPVERAILIATESHSNPPEPLNLTWETRKLDG
jgi:hypothetical protein